MRRAGQSALLPPRQQYHAGAALQADHAGPGLAVQTPVAPAYTFEDTPPDSTFFGYVETIVAHGVATGYPCGNPGEPCVPPSNRGYFRPANNGTRGQLSKMLYLALSYP